MDASTSARPNELTLAYAKLQRQQKLAASASVARPVYVSSSTLRQQALADVEKGVDGQLRYPPMPEEITAAKELALAHASTDADRAEVEHFFAACETRPPVAGQLITTLLGLHASEQRPEWALTLAMRWLSKLSYHEPAARKSTIARLAHVAALRLARPGELIDRQSDSGEVAYVLLTGACSVHLNLMVPPKPRWRPDDRAGDAPPRRPPVPAAAAPNTARRAEGAASASEAPPMAIDSLLALSIRDNAELLAGAATGSHDDAGDDAEGFAAEAAVGDADAAEVADGTNEEASPPDAIDSETDAKPILQVTAGSPKATPPAAEVLDDTPVDPALIVMEHGDTLSVLVPGDAYGEATCVLREPRRVSLVANTTCTLLVINKRSLDDFYSHATPSLAERLRFLAAMQLRLPPRLAHAFDLQRVARGDAIVKRGQPVERLTLVWSGSLSLRAPMGTGGGDGEGSRATDEISVVCAGGCVGDELLVPGLATTAPPLTTSTSTRQSRKPCVLGEYDAIAREESLVLDLALSDVERLPKATMRRFAEGASERHAHRMSQADQLHMRAAARTSQQTSSHRQPASSTAAISVAPSTALGPTLHKQRERVPPARLPPVGADSTAPTAMHATPSSLRPGTAPSPTIFGAVCTSKPVDPKVVDPLLLSTKVLTYGRRGATDAAESRRLANAHSYLVRSQPHVVARRMKRSATSATMLVATPPPKPPPQFRELTSSSHSRIVDGIREPPLDAMRQALAKEAQEATLRASKPIFTPPANAPSTFIQLRRMALEREFGEMAERSRMGKDFLMPTPLPKVTLRKAPPGRGMQEGVLIA